jgi:anti-sigma B factor antagonist
MAERLAHVRVIGMPMALYRKTAEHHDGVRRELSLMQWSDSDPPARLFTLNDELEQRFSDFTERPLQEIQDALDAGVDTLDLEYDLPADAADGSARLGEILDEVDSFCSAGEHLITLATPLDALEFRRWFLGEFIDQIAGRDPVPWPEYAARVGLDASATDTPLEQPASHGADERVLHVTGELDMATAPGLRDDLNRALQAGATRLRLDLTDVTFVDSVGMSVIVAAHHRCNELGGHLAVRVPPNIRRTMTVMALDQVLDIQD